MLFVNDFQLKSLHIAFLVSSSLKKAFKIVNVESDFIVCAKLDKSVTGYSEDIYLLATYIPPSNSSFYRARGHSDPFDDLSQTIHKYANLGQILILGDMNARTGNLPDFIENDEKISYPMKMHGSMNLMRFHIKEIIKTK